MKTKHTEHFKEEVIDSGIKICLFDLANQKVIQKPYQEQVCGVWGLESTEEQMHNEAVMLKTGFSFKKTGREEKELLVDKMRGGNISENFF